MTPEREMILVWIGIALVNVVVWYVFIALIIKMIRWFL